RRVALFLCWLSTGPPPTTLYTLSLHDALPIYRQRRDHVGLAPGGEVVKALREYPVPALGGQLFECIVIAEGDAVAERDGLLVTVDRKSTRLNSSHVKISYAVFCLKKKKKTNTQ